MKCIYLACLLAGAAAGNATPASAQTDIAASAYGSLSGTTKSGLYAQSSSNSAGALLEVRHIHNSLVGFEATYSYNQANQTYNYTALVPIRCPEGGICYLSGIAVSAYSETISGDWILSRTTNKFRPFALAGAGGLLIWSGSVQPVKPNISNIPAGATFVLQVPSTISRDVEPVFLFGVGLDWAISSHIGLRLQDRDSIYKSPQLLSTQIYPFGRSGLKNDLTYTQQPALGVYYQF